MEEPLAEPLARVRVVDCSEGIAGSKAAMFLADFGAEVVKVEPPGGETGRRFPGFAVWNRNKRGVTADAREPRLRELIARADLCVFTQPLTWLKANGLRPGSLVEANPRLVFLHLPAYAPEGLGSEFPESAQLLSAVSGIAFEQYKWSDVPVDPVMPHILYTQAMWGAVVATAALLERQRSGLGQIATVTGLHATSLLMTGTITDLPQIARGVRPGGAQGPVPFFRLYQCADGEWLIMAALTQAFYLKAFEILDVVEMLADERLGGEPAAMSLPSNAGWVIERLAEAFRARPRDEWIALLRDGGIPAGPARRRHEWFGHEQVRAISMRVALEDAERGHVEMPGIPLNLSATPGGVRSAAPAVGSDDWPDWGAVDSVEPQKAPQPSGPLTGIRVLDLGVVIAGSFPGTVMAELGADVIKIEPPTGDSLRAFAPTWIGYNKGKRSAVIDLQKPAGREVFLRLVRTADLVIDNYRPGVLDRLKLDYRSLRAVKPDIVCVSVTGYGEAGPLSADPGFDPVLQCGSGMMLAQGGDSGPTFITLPVTDTPTALMAALGGLLGLFHRNVTGEGQRATTSLAALSVMMQSDEIVEFAGRPPAAVGSRDHPGSGPLDRYYQAADGWLRLLATKKGDGERLVQAGLASASPPTAANLASSFSALAIDDAIGRLTAAGVLAVKATRKFRDLYESGATPADAMDEMVLANGNHIWASGRFASLSRTQRTDVSLPAGLGEHTAEVLMAVGLTREDLERLAADGTIILGAPLVI